MIKKIMFVCGVGCTMLANAQSSKFEGANIALNINAATMTTKLADTFALGESSTNASIQGAYSFALGEKSLLSVGATYAMGDLNAGSVSSSSVQLKAKNLYTIYVEPAYVMGTTAIYGKLAYIATKGAITASGVEYSDDFNGTGYGVGIRTMIDKNMYFQVEFMNATFNSKTIQSLPIQPGGTIGTGGIGYRF